MSLQSDVENVRRELVNLFIILCEVFYIRQMCGWLNKLLIKK